MKRFPFERGQATGAAQVEPLPVQSPLNPVSHPEAEPLPPANPVSHPARPPISPLQPVRHPDRAKPQPNAFREAIRQKTATPEPLSPVEHVESDLSPTSPVQHPAQSAQVDMQQLEEIEHGQSSPRDVVPATPAQVSAPEPVQPVAHPERVKPEPVAGVIHDTQDPVRSLPGVVPTGSPPPPQLPPIVHETLEEPHVDVEALLAPHQHREEKSFLPLEGSVPLLSEM